MIALVAGAVDAVGIAAADVVRFVLSCALCGLLGALLMDVPMSKQEDGFAPAYVAIAVFRRVRPEEIPFVEAVAVHHATGTLAGVVYALAYLIAALLVPALVTLGGVGLLPHLLSTAAVTGFVYAVFAYLILPRAGRRIYEERSTAVRGQWLRSVVVFGVALGVTVPALTTLV